MSDDEITKDIVIALIQQDRLVGADDVCTAYKQIIKTVNNPFDK